MFPSRKLKPAIFGSFCLVGATLPTLPSVADDHWGQYPEFTGKLSGLIAGLYGGDGIILCPAETCRHGGHFTASSLNEFNKLSLSVRDLSFPSINAKAGTQFKYDAVLDEFVPVTSSLSASVFAFDAETVGRNQFYLGLAYSERRFDTLGGTDLDDLTVDLLHTDMGEPGNEHPCIGGPPGACYAFEQDVVRLNLDVRLKEEMLMVTGAYGLTEKLDIGLLVPILRTSMSASSHATIIENPTRQFVDFTLHEFGGGGNPDDALQATRTGFGDMVLRLGYWPVQAKERKGWDIGLMADVRLPTGDTENLQGLPRVGFQPRLIVSRTLPFLGGKLRPHLNVSYGFNMGLQHEQQFDYAVGASYAFSWDDSATLAFNVDFLGKHMVVKRDGMGDDQYDVNFGLKANIWRNFSVFYSCLKPLNDKGLRASTQHIWGAQLRF